MCLFVLCVCVCMCVCVMETQQLVSISDHSGFLVTSLANKKIVKQQCHSISYRCVETIWKSLTETNLASLENSQTFLFGMNLDTCFEVCHFGISVPTIVFMTSLSIRIARKVACKNHKAITRESKLELGSHPLWCSCWIPRQCLCMWKLECFSLEIHW